MTARGAYRLVHIACIDDIENSILINKHVLNHKTLLLTPLGKNVRQ